MPRSDRPQTAGVRHAVIALALLAVALSVVDGLVSGWRWTNAVTIVCFLFVAGVYVARERSA